MTILWNSVIDVPLPTDGVPILVVWERPWGYTITDAFYGHDQREDILLHKPRWWTVDGDEYSDTHFHHPIDNITHWSERNLPEGFNND